jgi:hypothetical protein
MVTICAERQSRNVRPHWRLLRGERECIAFNEHYGGDGAIAAQSRPPTALRGRYPCGRPSWVAPRRRLEWSPHWLKC